MSLAVAIQMDPVEPIDINGDSSFVLGLEAQERGYTLWHYLPNALSLQDGKVTARARRLELRRELGDAVAPRGGAEGLEVVEAKLRHGRQG